MPGLGNTAVGISNVSLRTPEYVPTHITFHGKLSQGSTLTVDQPNYEAVRLKMNWSYHISFCLTDLKIIDPLRVITTGACSSGGSGVKNPPANTGDPGSIPGLERSPGEENGIPLQCACLENPMDRRVGGLPTTVRKELDMSKWLNNTNKELPDNGSENLKQVSG